MSSLRQNENGLPKVIVYGHKTVPSREGGIEVVVQEITTRMADRGYDVTCLNRDSKSCIDDYSKDVSRGVFRGVKLKTVPTVDRIGLAAASSSFFAAWAAALGPYDVVHIHAEGPAAFCWIPKLFGKKVVVTIHGLDWQRDRWSGFAKKYIRFGEKMAATHADEMIVLSREMERYFRNEYNRDTVYIPNGTALMPSTDPELIRERYGLEKDGYILYLARLVPEKKADVLIRAFRKLKTDMKLVIAGPDSETDEYACRLHELAGDDPRIIFTGFVKDRLYEELMSNAYVYVLPSGLEGMPLSLLEAMGHGNCCVTTTIPECKEVIGTHGVTVEPGNAEELALALQHLIENPSEVAGYREEARFLIETKYSWDDVVKQTTDIYKKAAGWYYKNRITTKD